MIRALVAAAALLAGCTVAGVPGMSPSTSAGADDAEDAPDGEAEARTTATAAGLPDGIAGTLCDQEGIDLLRDQGYDGPCWDPPGFRIAARMPAAAIRGRRAMDPPVNDPHAEIWWFDIPGDAEMLGSTNCPRLAGAHDDAWHAYEPYDDGGLTPFVVPDLMGLPIGDVLDRIDALDLPACVTVTWETSCDGGHGKVCMQSTRAGDPIVANGGLQLIVGSDVVDAGTPDEQRRYPEVVNRPVDDVVADLTARGFTNVEVVEDTVACERGVVCEAEPGNAGFVGTHEEIRLIVRRAKR